jgi:hypothetical protein
MREYGIHESLRNYGKVAEQKLINVENSSLLGNRSHRYDYL